MISIFIDTKLEKYKNEIKHAFGFIFNSLGYNHHFVSSPEKLRANDILLSYCLTEPNIEELKEHVGQYITIFVPADPSLYDYRSFTPDKLRRAIREVKLLGMTPIISERKFDNPAENYSDDEIVGGKINFDLVGNIFFHLADLEPQLDNQRDSYDCFPENASAFYAWKEVPYIDNLLWLLDSMIKELSRQKKQYIVQKVHYPENQQIAVILSHTVDTLQKWDASRIMLSAADDIFMFVTFKWQQLLRNIASKVSYLFTNYEMYWNFDEYRDLERDFGYKSTYFFAAEACNDIDYSLDDPELQEEIANILREGHEIGLLATADKLNRDDFVTKKQIMLHQIHKHELGLRQLGFRLNETLKDLHLKASPRFSSSVAFQDSTGFKNGFSLPFQPCTNNQKAPYLEIPLVYRDKYLRVNKYRYLQLEDAKHQIKKMFQHTLRTGGVFAIDFGIADYSDIPYCKKLYQYILALIESNKTWVTTCSDLCDWWEKRSRVTIEEGEYEISLSFPDDLESFVLQILNDHKIAEISGVDAVIDANLVKFSNIKAGAIAIIRLQVDRR